MEFFEPRNHWPSPFELIARRQRKEKLATARGVLPAANRRLIRLRYWNGLTFGEIASCMDRTPEAVEAMHARAIEKMRERLAASKIVKLADLL